MTDTNYIKTFEKTNNELNPVDFADMKNSLVLCSKELESAMLSDPEYIDWLKASRNLQLSEEVIRKNIGRLDRPFIVKVQQIPGDVLEEQLAHFDWEDVQKYQKLPLSIIKINGEIFNPKIALQNVKYDQKTLEYLANVDSETIPLIFQYQTVDEQFIEPRMNQTNVELILQNQKLSPEFIEKHFKEFKPDTLVRYQQLSQELIEKHIDNFDLTMVIKHQNVSFDFCIKHKYNASLIIMYQTPTLDYIKQSIQYNENSKTVLFNRITAPKRFRIKPLVDPTIESYILSLYTSNDISMKELDSEFIIRHAETLDMMTVLKNNKLNQ
jgi:hypothetical protein